MVSNVRRDNVSRFAAHWESDGFAPSVIHMKIVAGVFLAHPTNVEQLMRELLYFFTKYNQDLELTLLSPGLSVFPSVSV